MQKDLDKLMSIDLPSDRSAQVYNLGLILSSDLRNIET